MILHYWKIAGRAIRRHIGFSLINILGLSIGIASCLVIYLYVHHEMSYDDYHPAADRIARVTTLVHSQGSDLSLAGSPELLAPTLVKEFPEVEAAVRIKDANIVIRRGGDVFSAPDFFYSEQGIFSLFTFSFIEGTAAGALTAPHSIVLTRTVAKKYFGDKPALGQTLLCSGRDYRITAVIADQPANTDLKIDALMSRDFSTITSWTQDDFDTYTFVLFHQKPDLRRFDQRISLISKKYMQPEMDAEKNNGYHFAFESEALKDVHFSQQKYGDTPKGNRAFNKVFSALAVFILVIALLNYVNLATARATERMKEVGVRKVIGAQPFQLVRQFLGESSLLVSLAWVVAIGLVEISLPLFNRVLSTRLSYSGWPVLVFPLLLLPLTVLLAGGYPAFVLSRLRPVKALKSSFVRQSGGSGLRKILTVLQFVIALAMLAGTILFYQQMHYVAQQDLGVDRSKMICMNIPADSLTQASAPAFFQALRQESGISGVSIGSGLPTEGFAMSSTNLHSNGREKQMMCNFFMIDPPFLSLLHIPLVAGRNFSDSFSTDKKEGFIVNEAFVAKVGWKVPLGQYMESGFDRKGKVIGVVKNFFFRSLHNAIEPAVLIYRPDAMQAALVKAQPDEITQLKKLWKTYLPSQPFDYYFMQERFDKQYAKDKTTLWLFNAFTGLAIFISCLGLYGLVSLITVQRAKEIGIRTVLGATLSQLVLLLSKDQVRLIGVASCIALPLAALGADRWLSSYAYHASVNVWMFVLPVGALLLLALVVTGYRILRAALRNPVQSLRSE